MQVQPMKILACSLSLLSATVLAAQAAPTAPAPATTGEKRVIVCTVTLGWRHSSIPTAEAALQKLSDESHAFKIVEFARQPEGAIENAPSRPGPLKPDASAEEKERHEKAMKTYEADVAKWTPEVAAKAEANNAKWNADLKASMAKLSPENLKAEKIDGVIFANTTGDLPLPDKEGFIRWIEDGHAFIAMHSGSDTLHGFPGYRDMLGGEFKTHRDQVGADLIQADAEHPAAKGLPAQWNIAQEEMYIIQNQNREKVHTIYFLRHDPNFKEDKTFHPVSWCREAGKGRVFYTSLGHREDLWSDDPALPDRKNSVEISKQYQKHILGGIKWALGLEPGSAVPNPEVN